MNRLIRAELFKIRASRVTWILVGLAPPLCVLWAGLMVALAEPAGATGPQIENVYNMAQQSYVFALVLGVLGVAGEYRHQTITWQFLVTPVRSRVITAKLAAYGIVGLLVGLLSALVTLLAGLAMLGLAGHPAWTPQVPLVLLGSVFSVAVYGLLGVGLGALIRNQVAAVAVALAWFMYADYLLTMLLPGLGRWLPTGAARALGGMHLQDAELLPVWAGGLLFAGYVVVTVLAARLLTLRRDVT
ncbi:MULTISPECIES: ABC transporter permease [unclassified Streptosporangium]|uniref:ABC transporter permease n=1 Tax=unclassified Streptosporangium TaxID=2632669 RepID=UPI002E27CDCD|nr:MULTISPECIES: ABC transporter permease [unclassified Streptosporangium]